MLFLLIDLRQAYLVGVHNCKQAGLGELQTKENYGNSSFDTLLRFAFYFCHSKHAKWSPIYAAADFAWSWQLETVAKYDH